jgi:hypothetical protein
VKKAALFVIILVAVMVPYIAVFAPCVADEATGDRQVLELCERNLRLILTEMEDIVEKHNKNDIVYETFADVRLKSSTGRMHYSISMKDDCRKLGGGYFGISEEESVPVISLCQEYLSPYPKHRTFVYCTLIHEMKHAHDYFVYGDLYIEASKNVLERYLFQIDALYVEALFIQNYLRPELPSLAPYEEFILNSLQHDDLQRASQILLRVDRDLIHTMIDLQEGYLGGETDLKEFLISFRNLGNSILGSTHTSSGNEWSTYASLVGTHTYQLFASIIVQFALRTTRVLDGSVHAGIIGEINEIVEQSYERVVQNVDFFNRYHTSLKGELLPVIR